MKLQLEDKNLACMKLTVVGPVNAADAQVLRAGFKSLMKRARTAFLMDLNLATVEPGSEFAVLSIHIDALVNKIRLIIIGSHPKVCQARTLKEAQAFLTAVTRLDRVLIPQLYGLQGHLEARSDVASSILGFRPENHYPMLLAENRRLKERIADYEAEISELMKGLITPADLGELADRRREAERNACEALKEYRFFESGEGAP